MCWKEEGTSQSYGALVWDLAAIERTVRSQDPLLLKVRSNARSCRPAFCHSPQRRGLRAHDFSG